MPKIFGIFTLSAFALMGVPGLCGFVSKFYLAKAAVDSGNPLAYIGIAAILVSAILTAIYMVSIVLRVFFPQKGFDESSIGKAEDPNWMMLLPLGCFCIGMLVIGIYSQPLIDLFTKIANGLF